MDAQQPSRGHDQIWDFLREYGVLAVLPLMGLPVVRGPRTEALALWTAIVLYLVFVGMTGGDWMPFQRFFLPALPLASVLLAWGAARFREEVRPMPALARVAGFALMLAALGFYGRHAHAAWVDTQQERAKLSEAAHVKRHTVANLIPAMDLARWVIRKPGERLVTDYAGVFAVFTEAHVIDMWGLCNQDIALKGGIQGINPIYGKECARCYPELDPDPS